MNPSSRKKNPGDRTLNPADLAQLKAAGITPAQVRRQIALLRKAGHHRELHRPCTIGDGIHRISPDRSPIPDPPTGRSRRGRAVSEIRARLGGRQSDV